MNFEYATISFDTTDRGKDFDTNVSVSLVAPGGQPLALWTGDFGAFFQHTASGHFYPDQFFTEDLDPSAADAPILDPTLATIKIHISPVGHDTWHFRLTLRYWLEESRPDSPGGELTSGQIDLDQDHPDFEVLVSEMRPRINRPSPQDPPQSPPQQASGAPF